MNTTPTDPGAIDLKPYKDNLYQAEDDIAEWSVEACEALIAAVEALRAQIVELAEHLDKTIATAADAVNRMNANKAEIKQLRGHVAELARVLNGIVTAWEALPGPRHYSPGEVQKWLSGDMKLAIDATRTVLAALP